MTWSSGLKLTFRQLKSPKSSNPCLVIVSKVQKSGKHVTSEDIQSARVQGATDTEIHDTVLIAAAFCMYNRYVEGIGYVATS